MTMRKGAAPAAPNPYAWMTGRGWHLLPVRSGGKEPLTPHGVKDATTDKTVITGWCRRWPDMNIAVACGAPGPQVLDIDNPTAIPAALMAKLGAAPRVATARGGHVYFAGTDQGTIKLEFGELRGRGSYVLVPPSIHPSGKEYVWVSAPRGPLPAIPLTAINVVHSAGRGVHEPPRGHVPHGQRHPYLVDFAVRLVCAGVTDTRRIVVHLRCEFEASCEPAPAPDTGYFDRIAEWAIRSRIAQRERRRNGR